MTNESGCPLGNGDAKALKKDIHECKKDIHEVKESFNNFKGNHFAHLKCRVDSNTKLLWVILATVIGTAAAVVANSLSTPL